MKTIFKCGVWATTILWLLLVFCFSAETGAQSMRTSAVVTESVLEAMRHGSEQPWEAVDTVLFFFRKAAHFLLYTAGGFFLGLSAWFVFEDLLCLVPSMALGVLYAMSDEIHQLFVPLRSCRLKDVLIDSGGVLLGTLIALLFLCVLRRLSFTKREASAKGGK